MVGLVLAGSSQGGPLGRSASRLALAMVLLCPIAVAGCGTDDEPRTERVAFCQGPTADTPDGATVQVEFRQDSAVVADRLVQVGDAVTVEVPVGGVRIYVDGALVGAVHDGPASSPTPGPVAYVRISEGCPETPPS